MSRNIGSIAAQIGELDLRISEPGDMASMKNHPVNEKDCRGSDLSRKMACAAKKPELVSSMILGNNDSGNLLEEDGFRRAPPSPK